MQNYLFGARSPQFQASCAGMASAIALSCASTLGWIGIAAIAPLVVASPVQAASLTQWNFDLAANQLEITVPSGITPRYFLAAEPARIVLDLPNTEMGAVPTQQTYSAGAVRQIRVAQFQPGQTRIVIELAPGTVLASGQVELRRVGQGQTGDRWVVRPLLAGDATTPTATAPRNTAPAATAPGNTAPAATPTTPAPAATPPTVAPAAIAPRTTAPAATPPLAADPATPAPVPRTIITPSMVFPGSGNAPAAAPNPASHTSALSNLPPLEPRSVQIPVAPASEPAPTTPAPTTPAPVTPAPTTPAPVTPAPTTPAPTPTPAPTASQPAPEAAIVLPVPSPSPASPSPSSSPAAPVTVPTVPAASTVPPASTVPAVPPVPAASPVPAAPAPSGSATQPAAQPSLAELPAPDLTPAPSQQQAPSVPPLPAAPAAPPSVAPSANPATPAPATPAPPTPAPATPAAPSSTAPVPGNTVTSPGSAPNPAAPNAAPNNVIEFGQPLPLQSSLLPADVLIPAGTVLNLRYAGETPIALSSQTPRQEVLLLTQAVRDRTGNVIIPANSQVIGRFETSSQGSQFIAQSISWQDKNLLVKAESEVLRSRRQRGPLIRPNQMMEVRLIEDVLSSALVP